MGCGPSSLLVLGVFALLWSAFFQFATALV